MYKYQQDTLTHTHTEDVLTTAPPVTVPYEATANTAVVEIYGITPYTV